MSAPPPRAAFATALACLVGAGAALRFPRLASVPNAAHDEGNWLLAGWQRAHGHPEPLPPDARFVTDLFARLIGLAMRALGDTVAAARMVPVLGLLAGTVAVAWAARRAAGPRPALALAALLLVHPWSVLWSRNVVTPYAFSLVLAALVPLLANAAWSSRGSPLQRVVCLQAAALGFHFSPLAALTVAATSVQLVSDADARRRLRSPSTAVALALALAHVAPIAAGAVGVAQHGATRPSAWFDHFAGRLGIYLRTVLGVLSGEATVRDFTGAAHHAFGEAAAAMVVVAVLVVALREGHPALRRIGAVHLATGLLGLPLLLAPMRQWNLPSVDSERYGFVLLAPAAMLAASLASGRARALATVAVLGLALGPTARAARWFLHGGGPDHGLFTADGGGSGRRWKVTPVDVPVVEQILRAADAIGDGRPVTVYSADYVFHPLYFANASRPHRLVEPAVRPLMLQPGEPVLFVRWADAVFAPDAHLAADLAAQRDLTARMHAPDVEGLRLLRTLRQPDGEDLVELWVARGAVDARPPAMGD